MPAFSQIRIFWILQVYENRGVAVSCEKMRLTNKNKSNPTVYQTPKLIPQSEHFHKAGFRASIKKGPVRARLQNSQMRKYEPLPNLQEEHSYVYAYALIYIYVYIST